MNVNILYFQICSRSYKTFIEIDARGGPEGQKAGEDRSLPGEKKSDRM